MVSFKVMFKIVNTLKVIRKEEKTLHVFKNLDLYD